MTTKATRHKIPLGIVAHCMAWKSDHPNGITNRIPNNIPPHEEKGRVGEVGRRLMHLVPAPAVRLMKTSAGTVMRSLLTSS